MLVDRYGNPVINHSNIEQKTGETWIDGKPIYTKTINTGALNPSSAKNVAHNISNIGSYIVVDQSNSYARNNEGICVNIPRPGHVAQDNVGIFVGSINVVINTSSAAQFSDSYVTLRYTKTTD